MLKLSLLQAPTPETSRDQLREQIRQSVQQATAEARAAAQEGARAAREAAQAAGQAAGPGQAITIQRPFDPNDDIPPRAQEVAIAFFVVAGFCIIGFPIMRAIAKRIERGSQPPAKLPAELQAQLQQLSQSVDAIAIEVERISEGQRFTTKMLADRKTD